MVKILSVDGKIISKKKKVKVGNGESKMEYAIVPAGPGFNESYMSKGLQEAYTLPRFVSALRHPFGLDANGLRVPDPYSWPTITAKLQGRMAIGSDTFGRAHRMFLPNPIISSASFLGTTNSSSQVVFSTAQYASKATSGANLATMFSTYRVASWGIKISNLQPMLTATGRVMLAIVPCGSRHLSENVMESGNVTTSEFCQFATGLGDFVFFSGAQLQLPASMELTVNDLLKGSMEIGSPTAHPCFFEFKSCSNVLSVNSGNTYVAGEGGDQFLINTTTFANSHFGSADATRLDGGCAINLYFEGLPTSSPNIFDIEYVYHLEGTPAVVSVNNNSIPVPSGNMAVAPGRVDTVPRAVGEVAGLKSVSWLDKAASFLSAAAPVVGMVSPIAGAFATGLAGVASALR